MTTLVVTAADCMTAIGLDAAATTAAARAGISRLRESRQFVDTHGAPIVEACIPWLPEEPEADNVGAEPAALGGDGDNPDETEAAGDGSSPGNGATLPAAEDEALDPYELARHVDDERRIVHAAWRCFSDLLQTNFEPAGRVGGGTSLLFAVGGPWRPGPRMEGASQGTAAAFLSLLAGSVPRPELAMVPTGNAAVIHGLALAANRVANDPLAVSVVAALDSLLPSPTLDWYETAGRLKSGSPGRNHGLPPAEGVGFLVVETAESARRGARPILAEVLGLGLTTEPNPFLSDRPSRGEGLTAACRNALAASRIAAAEVGASLIDLDGEFHRAKEWAFAEARCFGGAGTRALVHPADCLGSVGAASGAVLVAIATAGFSGGWFTQPVLVVCSDDAGECGAVVLAPPGYPRRS